jgi:hypothetical protein
MRENKRKIKFIGREERRESTAELKLRTADNLSLNLSLYEPL